MRYVQVTPEGEVLGLENKAAIKYAYGSMLFLRVALPYSFAFGFMIFPARNLFELYQKMGVQNEPQNKKELIDYLTMGNGIVVANTFAKKLF